MKKIFVLLMAVVMSIRMIACGGGEEDIVEAEDGEAKFNFGFEVRDDFAMAEALKKIDYTDISKQTAELEEMMAAAVKEALPGDYPMTADYEEDDEDSIDKLAYVMAIEDDDSEKSFLETGAYHNKDDDKYYQYTVYTSDNFYDNSADNIEKTLQEISSAYGVIVSQDKVQEAVDIILEGNPEDEEYFYYLYEDKEIKGDGYTEKITLAVEGFDTEDNTIGYYISVERERCYS